MVGKKHATVVIGVVPIVDGSVVLTDQQVVIPVVVVFDHHAFDAHRKLGGCVGRVFEYSFAQGKKCGHAIRM